jgi:hypothetical protein
LLQQLHQLVGFGQVNDMISFHVLSGPAAGGSTFVETVKAVLLRFSRLVGILRAVSCAFREIGWLNVLAD